MQYFLLLEKSLINYSSSPRRIILSQFFFTRNFISTSFHPERNLDQQFKSARKKEVYPYVYIYTCIYIHKIIDRFPFLGKTKDRLIRSPYTGNGTCSPPLLLDSSKSPVLSLTSRDTVVSNWTRLFGCRPVEERSL